MSVDHDPKAKFALHYATDITKPPGAAPSTMVQFRSRFAFFIYLARNKSARDAVRAGRFQFFTIVQTTLDITKAKSP